MSEKKKPTRRSGERFPGLVQAVNPRTRWELIDHDYINQLSDEEKQWLSNFNEEYLSGNFNHKGKKFHKTKKQKRDCYNRNNSRNRDVFTLYRTHGWIVGADAIPDAMDKHVDPFKSEDNLLDLLDAKNKIDKETKDS